MSIREKIVQGVAKAFGVDLQSWIQGTDEDNKTTVQASQPYQQVATVFACVEKLINGVLGIPFVLSDVNENIIEAGPAYDLLMNNTSLSFERFVTETIGHYALSRDVFWVFELDGIKIKNIQVVSGTQMHAVTRDGTRAGQLTGWEYIALNGERTRLGLQEVHQWKNFNPYDPHHGIGPTKAAKLNLDYTFQAALHATSSLTNAAEPGLILLTEGGSLGEEKTRLLRSQFDSRHQGPSKPKRTAVLSGIKSVETVAMNIADLQLAELGGMNCKQICAAFGVRPELVGFDTEAQYSGGPAMRDFIFNTIIPFTSLFAGHITSGILARALPSTQRAVNVKDAKFYTGRKNLSRNKYFKTSLVRAATNQRKIFAWFDAGQHPIVQEANNEIAAKVLDYTKSGIPVNQLIDAHDLPYEKTEAGEEFWISAGLVPARYILEAGVESLTGPSLPEGTTPGEEEIPPQGEQDKKSYNSDNTKDLRRIIWTNWYKSWIALEREMNSALRGLFLRQQREILARLKAALANKAKSNQDIIAQVVFDLEKDNDKLRVISRTFFKRGAELGVRQGLTEMGISGDALAQTLDATLRRQSLLGKLTISTHKISGVNRTTKKLLENQLTSGLESGEGLEKLSDRVKKVLGSNRQRSLSIARTQTASAVSTGRHEGLSSASCPKHGWVDSHDSEVRDAHKAAGQKYADGIPTDQPFEVDGEQLMHPGDPRGSAANIINCRCMEVALAQSKGLSFWAAYQFYSYEQMQKEISTDGKK